MSAAGPHRREELRRSREYSGRADEAYSVTPPIRHRVFEPRARIAPKRADPNGISFVESEYVAGLRMARHADAETRITLVVAGGCTESVGRCENYCGPGSVVLKPAGADHANVFGDRGMTAFSIRFPAQAVAPHAHRWTHGGPIARLVIDIYRLVASDGESDSEAIDAALFDVFALLSNAPSGVRAGHLPRWLDDIRDRLHDGFRDRVNVRELAEMVATHPVYLARVFRRRFGCSVLTYVHRLRTHHAAELLGGTQTPYAQIAVRAGFADQAHFCRVFKSQTGVTPAAYRRLIRGA